MEVQCSVFIATSLDGFIARTDGGIDWLISGSPAPGGEDYGYGAFIGTIDALVMGRHTFELASTFPLWPYGSRRVIVLSKGYPASGKELSEVATGTSATPGQVVEMLSRGGFRRVYVDGGKTIQGFLEAGLITDMTVTRVPLLLGDGIPLFGGTGREIGLRHVETRSFPSGFVQSTYEVLGAR